MQVLGRIVCGCLGVLPPPRRLIMSVKGETASRFRPPESVRGMTRLEPSEFRSIVRVRQLTAESRHTKQVLRYLRPFLLRMAKLKSVRPLDEDGARTGVLLEPHACSDDELAEFARRLDNAGVQTTVAECDVQLTFDNWTARDVLDAVLPEGVHCTSFSQVGHVLQLSLHDDQLPHKDIIGQVLLRKVQRCRTVINKADVIESQFRTLPVELLAGDADFQVTVRENGCSFGFDYSKVFWNGRLSGEHERMVAVLERRSLVYDACAGVGPFAIPAAKKGAVVLANDLNPDCAAAIRHNAALNGVALAAVHQLSADTFIRTVVADHLVKRLAASDEAVDAHVLMNLPGSATDFLPAFVGLLREAPRAAVERCRLRAHCYLFTRASDAAADAEARVRQEFGAHAAALLVQTVHDVRDVAPYKRQVCVSALLPPQILCAEPPADDAANDSAEEPAEKRLKM